MGDIDRCAVRAILGPASVKAIFRERTGRIRVDSEEGQGTVRCLAAVGGDFV